MKTKAPSSMKRFAAARPMPVAPPVITAVFPFSLFMSYVLLERKQGTLTNDVKFVPRKLHPTERLICALPNAWGVRAEGGTQQRIQPQCPVSGAQFDQA